MAINYEKILEKLLAAVERLPDEQRGAFDYYTTHAAELRAYIKQRGAELKAAGMKENFPLYDFGDGLPTVDARFLLDILEILPGASFRASSYRPDIGGIYFESADGFGILLPVRKPAAQKSA